MRHRKLKPINLKYILVRLLISVNELLTMEKNTVVSTRKQVHMSNMNNFRHRIPGVTFYKVHVLLFHRLPQFMFQTSIAGD